MDNLFVACSNVISNVSDKNPRVESSSLTHAFGRWVLTRFSECCRRQPRQMIYDRRKNSQACAILLCYWLVRNISTNIFAHRWMLPSLKLGYTSGLVILVGKLSKNKKAGAYVFFFLLLFLASRATSVRGTYVIIAWGEFCQGVCANRDSTRAWSIRSRLLVWKTRQCSGIVIESELSRSRCQKKIEISWPFWPSPMGNVCKKKMRKSATPLLVLYYT